MASSSSTTVTPHLNSDLPPWKIELIQRKRKFNTVSVATSPNGSIQRTITQFDNNNDGNFGKCSIMKKMIKMNCKRIPKNRIKLTPQPSNARPKKILVFYLPV